jgi:hypothetical protein
MKKQDLLNVLERVKPGLAQKDMIEQATSFAFMGNRVVTFNDEISISHQITDLDITGAIKAEELYKFLSKIKTDDIDLTIQDNEMLIKSGKAKVGLTIQSEINLPLSELGEVGNWKKIPEDFFSTLEIVRFCCSKDMSRPKLTCINVRKDGLMESCDNFRAIRFQMKTKCPYSFLLPASSASVLLGYPSTLIATSPGWVHFADQDKTIVFSCRIYSEEYNDLEANFVLPKSIPFTFPAESLEILERAQIFAKGDIFLDQQVDVSAEGRRLFFRVKKAGSWFEEWAKIDTTPPFATSVHPQFLRDILKLTRVCEIVPGQKMKFTGENWEHVAAMSATV